jgi:hypothetical protein
MDRRITRRSREMRLLHVNRIGRTVVTLFTASSGGAALAQPTVFFLEDVSGNSTTDAVYSAGTGSLVTAPNATTVFSPLPNLGAVNIPSTPADLETDGTTLYYSDNALDGIYKLPTTPGGPVNNVLNLSGGTDDTINSVALNASGNTAYFSLVGTADAIGAVSTSASGATTYSTILDLDTAFGTNTYTARGLAYHATGGPTDQLFVGSIARDAIYRADIDPSNPLTAGTSPITFATNTTWGLATTAFTINALAVDSDAGKLYVLNNASTKDILAINLDGTGATTVLSFTSLFTGTITFQDLEYFDDRLYVTDSSDSVNKSIYSIDPESAAPNKDLQVHVNGYRTTGLAVLPEPATGILLAAGAGLMAMRRRRLA